MKQSLPKADPIPYYDVAVIGAGMAGLMLVRELLNNPRTATLRVLLVEKAIDGYAPRTWCFWEERCGFHNMEPGIQKEWAFAEVLSGEHRHTLRLSPFLYSMIDAGHWRQQLLDEVSRASNVGFVVSAIRQVEEREEQVVLTTADRQYAAGWVFDSRWEAHQLEGYKGPVFFQQFIGRRIKSTHPLFDPQHARMMDFRTQQRGAVAFCYLLPLDEQQALVEYTLFTQDIRDRRKLEDALDNYIDAFYPGEPFSIQGREEGVIPMTSYAFPAKGRRIVGIGTAGGCTKPSTGYTFIFARRHAESIAGALAAHRRPPAAIELSPARFRFYDEVLLRVLQRDPERGAGILFRLFCRNKPATVLKFLENRSTLWEECRIFLRLPVAIFLRAAIVTLFNAGRLKWSGVRLPDESRPPQNSVRETEVD